MANSVAKKMLLEGDNFYDLNTFYYSQSPIILVQDLDIINGEIYNVATTKIGEEWWEPTYGSNIPNRIFDPMNNVTAWHLEHDLHDALILWVPQIIINQALTRAVPRFSERCYDLTVVYSVVTYSSTFTFQFQISPNQF